MAKRIKIQGVEGLSKRIGRNVRIQVAQIFRSEELRKRVGEIVERDIKLNYEHSKPPEESTRRWRERYGPYNDTDPQYDPDKLKALFTGELLEDIKNNVVAVPTDFSFEIGHSDGKHSRYRGPTGLLGKSTPYKVISDYLINKLKMNYMVLTPEAQKEITDAVREEIYKLLA